LSAAGPSWAAPASLLDKMLASVSIEHLIVMPTSANVSVEVQGPNRRTASPTAGRDGGLPPWLLEAGRRTAGESAREADKRASPGVKTTAVKTGGAGRIRGGITKLRGQWQDRRTRAAQSPWTRVLYHPPIAAPIRHNGSAPIAEVATTLGQDRHVRVRRRAPHRVAAVRPATHHASGPLICGSVAGHFRPAV